MAAVSSPPPAIGGEDFAFHSSPPHSTAYGYEEERSRLSSPPAALSASPDPSLSRDSYIEPERHYAESSASAPSDEHNEFDEEEEMARLNGAATTSSRSSISSLPASVSASAIVPPPDAITPTKSPPIHRRMNSLTDGIKSPGRRTERDSPFRHPSSVRAMQMMDEEDMVTPHHRTSVRHDRTSGLSARSSINSLSPTKKSARSLRPSPQKPKVKKEYPLVLLHCSLLPPSLPLNLDLNVASHRDLLQEVLPEEYWRRWKLLVDKVGGNGVVRERGILIPHPRNEYDLLEERLLESLELTQGKIRSGHFLGNEDVEEEDEDDDIEEVVNVSEGQKCPDCGKNVLKDLDVDRKWEVKVYAANGLMRAGAWAAAWSEMERVDVEVSLWLPENIRRDAETRVQEAGMADMVDELGETEEEKRRREVYGEEPVDTQEKVDGLDDPDQQHAFDSGLQQHHHETAGNADVQTMLLNYFKLLARDRRNIAIVLLSFLVFFLSMASSPTATPAPPVAVQVVPTPMATVSECAPIMVSSVQAVVLQTTEAAEEQGIVESAPTLSTEMAEEELMEM